MFKVPGIVKQFASFFFQEGYECYLVGGAVRDMLLGRKCTDFDIATDAMPDDVHKLFRRVIPTGIKHGTVTVLFMNTKFEVTTFRIDGIYMDGRRPDSVTYTPSIMEDLKRRDFTINAIAYHLKKRAILDPHNGRDDLRKGIIRAIGDPVERFREDGLRPVRACRFAAQFNFQIESNTFKSIEKTLDVVKQVSVERIRDELIRIFESEKPSIGLKLMNRSGLLQLIMPELINCIGVRQRDMHCFDVFEHLLYSCDAADRNNLIVRVAALLHDIGKPDSSVTDTTDTIDTNGSLTFYRHEQLSAESAESITRRLRFPNMVIKKVAHLIRHHMFNYSDEWSDAAIRRFVARVGEENIPDILSLRRADQIGMCGKREISHSLIAFEDRIHMLLQKEKAFTVKDLNADGKDIITALSISPGPSIGIILNMLLDAVLEDPDLNQKDKLLEIAKKFYDQRIGR